MIDQDQTYLLQSYNQNQSLFANIDSSFQHKKSHKSLSNRQNSKKTLNLAAYLQSNSNTMTNIMDVSNEIKSKKFQQDIWYRNEDINIKMLDSIWEDKIAEGQRTASKSIFNYMTKKNERSSKDRGFIEDNTVNIKDRKRTETSQNTVQNSGRAILSGYTIENRNRAASQNQQIKMKQKNIQNGENIVKMMEQKTRNIRKESKNKMQNEKQNNKQIINMKKNNENLKFKLQKDESLRQIERQMKIMLDRQNDQTQEQSMRKKIRKLQTIIQQIYRRYQQKQITIEQYQRLVYRQKQVILQQKQQYQLQIQEYESKTKRLQNMISSMHSQYLQEISLHKNNIKNISNVLQVKQFQIYNFISKRVACFKKELSQYYASQYRDGYQDNGNKIYTCNSKANLIAQYGMSNLPSNNTKSVPLLHYDPSREQQTQTKEQKKQKQKQKQKQKEVNRNEAEVQLNQLPSISLSVIPKLSTILQHSNEIYKETVNEHKQANENFRRLTTFRIKQLQKQNSYLQNEVNTSQMKVMIIQNQNKQLREIVEGMIQQMKKLGIYPSTYQANDANCTFGVHSYNNCYPLKWNGQQF